MALAATHKTGRRVEFFGVGNSGIVAQDAQHKFFRLGITSIAYSDGHMQVMSASLLGPGDCLVIVSNSGRTRDLMDAADIARKHGATVITIEKDADRCAEIADKLSGTMILNGDGSDLALLQEEGAGAMDVVYAVTGLDDKNLLCSLLVKQLGATKILSRVNRNVYIKLFEMVGVDRAVSPGQVTADAVLQRVIGGEEVITLSDERMELVDFIAKATGAE